jgi:hypothetical protein
MLRSEAEHIEIGEERRSSAGVNEHHVVVGRPSTVPNQGDEAGHAFAGIDRVEDQGLEATTQLHCLDRRRVREAVARTGVPSHDLDIVFVKRQLKEF